MILKLIIILMILVFDWAFHSRVVWKVYGYRGKSIEYSLIEISTIAVRVRCAGSHISVGWQ